MSHLLAEKLITLFIILAVGGAIGHVSLKGISLGGAGVLLTALIFGHFGLTVPHEIMDLGLVLFVYAVGLRVGPRFFRTFARQGRQFMIIGLAVVCTGAIVTIIVAKVMHLPFDLATGLYTGAMTCTPALAGALDALRLYPSGTSAMVSVGYGVAYPYSMIGLVLFIQILPRLLKRPIPEEEKKWQQEQAREQQKIEVKQYRIKNANCTGKSLLDLQTHRLSQVNITRVRRGDQVLPATADFVLALDDVVMAVGLPDELAKLHLLLGEETFVDMNLNTDVAAADAMVSDAKIAGKTLGELHVWERYNVVITRVRRQGLEFTPHGEITLEIGDSIHIVGASASVKQFCSLIDPEHQSLEETRMVPFLFGLAIGVLVGQITIPLGHGFSVKFGYAGGAFIVSLLLGHFGRLGRLRLYAPNAAINISRELGLMLFLAGAGTIAGSKIVPVVTQYGWRLLAAGALVSTISAIVGFLVMLRFFRMNLLATMGGISASFTNPPALGASSAQTRTEVPMLAYASVYPVALFFKIILAQILVAVLSHF